MTSTPEDTSFLLSENSLEGFGEIYAEAFTHAIIPLVTQKAGYAPVGKLVGIAKVGSQGLSVDLVFEYDNKNPDMWEEAQRYIFEKFLAMYVESFSAMRN